MSNAVRNVGEFGRVAVLMGGRSAERAVSLKSGQAVLDALLRRGVAAVAVDVAEEPIEAIRDSGCERAFIALHGRGGEDGVMQATLQMLNIPYTGSGVLASALGMDKLRTKQVWRGAGVATPDYIQVIDTAGMEAIIGSLGLPLIVKPIHEGSSIGMSRVDEAAQLDAAVEEALRYDSEVLIEQWISGEEYTVAILGGEALPAIRLRTPHAFYDYDAKYHDDTTEYLCPCGLSPNEERELQQLALAAFNAVGARGWGRVDVMRDQQGSFLPIEINTVPGMTDHSLVPMAASVAGIDFDSLVWRILELSLEG